VPAFICRGCGLQHATSETPPVGCLLCADERLGLPPSGWTTQAEMRRTHFVTFRRLGPGIMGIGTLPAFGQGQRALLVRTAHGNVLWDCLSFIDEATIALVTALGGISAIAVSHPHSYGAMVEWGHAFGSAPIYVHATDRRFVARPDSSVIFWDHDAFEIVPGATLLRCGGHFGGSAVLHWGQGANGRGAVLAGDTLRIGPDGQISFMRSDTNMIPLDGVTVQRIATTLAPWHFDTILGARWDEEVPTDAKGVLTRSVERYVAAVTEPPFSWSNL